MSVCLHNKARKDIERQIRRGKNVRKFGDVLRKIEEQSLEPRHRDHPLVGNWRGWRECHIEPDWLLIYRHSDDGIEVIRTGTHADLFGL